ncbi:MAG: hypothetical protein V4662_16950 [Verrucomicrobiota bacterium]
MICLWALREYRAWSARLAGPTMQSAARQVVHWISQNRIGISRLIGFTSDAEVTATAVREMQEPVCQVRPPAPPRHDLDLID